MISTRKKRTHEKTKNYVQQTAAVWWCRMEIRFVVGRSALSPQKYLESRHDVWKRILLRWSCVYAWTHVAKMKTFLSLSLSLFHFVTDGNRIMAKLGFGKKTQASIKQKKRKKLTWRLCSLGIIIKIKPQKRTTSKQILFLLSPYVNPKKKKRRKRISRPEK